MTVKDLLAMETDIDVYDDVTEELGICFCGPAVLTPAGSARYAEILNLPVKIGNNCAIVCVGDPKDSVWKRRLRLAKDLFESLAGYCTTDEYKAWFEET